MVAPVGDGNNQIMHLVEKISNTETSITTHGNFSFVPMLKIITNKLIFYLFRIFL